MNDQNENHGNATLLETVKAVLWSFFGVRNNEEYTKDWSRLSLKKIIIVGIIGTALFVLLLVMLVNFITR
jgi:hypothetical protein